MKLIIGCDHGATPLKDEIVKHLEEKGFDVEDVGTYGTTPVDYPDIAKKVCEKIQNKEKDLGILLCGTGIGISIAANKHIGIRASLCHNEYEAEMTRRHNDSNILVLGGRVIGRDLALSIVDRYLQCDFEGGRHQARLDKIDLIEKMQ